MVVGSIIFLQGGYFQRVDTLLVEPADILGQCRLRHSGSDKRTAEPVAKGSVTVELDSMRAVQTRFHCLRATISSMSAYPSSVPSTLGLHSCLVVSPSRDRIYLQSATAKASRPSSDISLEPY
jgi:hypothetical protein